MSQYKTCANRESNPALKLGKLQCYRYTIGAIWATVGYAGAIFRWPRVGERHRDRYPASPYFATAKKQRIQGQWMNMLLLSMHLQVARMHSLVEIKCGGAGFRSLCPGCSTEGRRKSLVLSVTFNVKLKLGNILPKQVFHARILTRVLWVKTTYPNQLDYAEGLGSPSSSR